MPLKNSSVRHRAGNRKPKPGTFCFKQGSFRDFSAVKSMSALHSKAPLTAQKKQEIKFFPLHFSFHLHSFTVHQRESMQPDTQGLFPSVIQQVLRPDRKPVFHSPLPCLIAGYF